MQYKFVMFMSWLVSHLPYGLVMALGGCLGNLYYLLIKKERERAVAQIMPALGLSETEARKTVRASFVNLARNVLEILYMPHLNEQNFEQYIEIDHLDRLKAALAENKGVVILTGHVGTWEWLSAAFTLNGLPVTAEVEILPYHTLGRGKWKELGWEYLLDGVPEPAPEQLQAFRQQLQQAGIRLAATEQ